jgi:hypothetical protein
VRPHNLKLAESRLSVHHLWLDVLLQQCGTNLIAESTFAVNKKEQTHTLAHLVEDTTAALKRVSGRVSAAINRLPTISIGSLEKVELLLKRCTHAQIAKCVKLCNHPLQEGARIQLARCVGTYGCM